MESAASLPSAGVTLTTQVLRQMRKTAGLSIWTWNAATDEVTSFADAAGGVAPATSSVRDALQAVHPSDRRRVEKRLVVAARGTSSGIIRFRGLPTPDGTRYYSASYFPQEGQPGPSLQLIVLDITRAVTAEQAFRESETHYRTAVALNPEIPWLADSEGRITEIGPRWVEFTGRSIEDSLGHGWTAVVHSEDLPATLSSWRQNIILGTPVDVEYRVRTAAGAYRWMRARATAKRDQHGKIIGWYGNLEDVQDRRVAVAALRESEEFARSILESSSIAISVLDAEGRIVFVNGSGIKAMELAEIKGVLNRNYEELWPEQSRLTIHEGIAQALRGNSVHETLHGMTPGGSPRWWDLTLSPIRDGNGQIARVLVLCQDVTEARQNQSEITSLARRLSNVLESTTDSVVTVDSDWQITFANRRAVGTFGDHLLREGRDLRELFGGPQSGTFFSRFREAMTEQRAISFEEYLHTARAWLEVHVYGSALGLTIFFRDVTERRRAQDQIAHLARHDALTDLANHVYFSEQLERALADRAPDELIAVLSVDLDDFKAVNDTLGHPTGDALLREVARRLRQSCGSSAATARMGGDEFAVFVPARNEAEIAAVAETLLDALSSPAVIDGETVEIGASIGIAVAPRDGTAGENLLQNADVALYRVKASHGHAYRYFEPEMDRSIRERREMKRDLATALARNEFSLVYQPQVETANRRLTGFEALLRWNHPTRGAVPPSEFISLAEESGLIEQIGTFVIETACREATHWPETISIAVNLSPAQFRRGEVIGSIRAALEKTGLSPQRLEIEITESVLLDEANGALEALAELHDMGIEVALDDFGTGYSSLSYLQRFPFDRIKIDRSFVSGLPGNAGSCAIVRSIIGLGHSLKTGVIAEGVETWEQLLFLSHEGCHDAQGYLFSRPIEAEAARVLADAGRLPGFDAPASPAAVPRRRRA